MKTTHIVLRSVKPSTKNIFLGPMAESVGFETSALSIHIPQMVVDVEKIEKNQIAKITKQADVLAIAPAMPVRLIKPMDIPTKGKATTNKIAWGIKAVGADVSKFSGDGVTVAILDTGIDRNHKAFVGVNIIEKDFTGEGNGDKVGHGTHCAGTILGRDVDGNRIGIARGVTNLLIGKVLSENGGSTDSIIKAIEWAVHNGANVISMSLGIDFPGYQSQLQQQGFPQEVATSMALEGYRANVLIFEKLAQFVRTLELNGSQPVIIVAAAGNESRRDEDLRFEIAVSPPAVSDGIISVAALSQKTGGLDVAPFSNTFANIAAPGVNILSAKAGGGLVAMSGTSMATPHVAGIAALWVEKIKNSGLFTNQILTARLIGSATNNGLIQGLDPLDIGAGLVLAP